jgi:deoxyribodipyrimidine photolyase
VEASLKAKGASLVLRRGPAANVVADVAREAGASAVFWNEIAYEPHLTIAKQLEAALAKLGVETKTFTGDLLVSPSEIRNKEGRGLRTFDAFSWKRDAKALSAWQRGRTGYPIVDAGMRQLWHTGVMHNRVRMVVASAVGGGLRRRCSALFPGVQSCPSGREVRPRRRLCAPLGKRTRRAPGGFDPPTVAGHPA